MSTTIQTTGRLGAEPELKTFQSGKQKCELRMAVKQRGERQADGSWIDRPAWWISVEVWGAQAVTIADKFQKGDLIDARGELERQTYTKRDGTPGEKLVVAFAKVEKIGSPKGQQQPAADTGACPMPATPISAQQGAQSLATALGGDEIPF
jgi:single-strand DNA-binding protein